MTTAVSTSPVAGAVRVLQPARPTAGDPAPRSRAVVRIEPSEPVLAGHYPDFPIFPGVCVVECAHRAVLATAPPDGQRLGLAELESARFVGAVFPGDDLTVDVTWKAVEGGWTCSAEAATERGPAAKVRLRYRNGARP